MNSTSLKVMNVTRSNLTSIWPRPRSRWRTQRWQRHACALTRPSNKSHGWHAAKACKNH